jgi:hypothetical protein
MVVWALLCGFVVFGESLRLRVRFGDLQPDRHCQALWARSRGRRMESNQRETQESDGKRSAGYPVEVRLLQAAWDVA